MIFGVNFFEPSEQTKLNFYVPLLREGLAQRGWLDFQNYRRLPKRLG
jgi:hypothetical protein